MKTQCQAIRRQGAIAIEVFKRADSVAALFLIIGVLSVLFSGGCDRSSPSETGNQETATRPAARRTFYEGYEADIEALRRTQNIARASEPALMASRGEAIAAARRIFENIDFVGMTREEVLELLGDPATISDYGVPAEPGPDQRLIFRFDSGFGGDQFTVVFKDERVVSIQRNGIY